MKSNIKKYGLIILSFFFIAGCREHVNGIKFNHPGTFPIAEEPVTLNFMISHVSKFDTDFKENLSTKYIEKQSGVHIEFNVVPEIYRARELAIVSNDMPDVFIGETSSAKVMQYAKEGKILPLNDLIDKYAPNIKKNLESDPLYRKVVTAPDGNIYALPDINDDMHGAYGPKTWINQVWLDNLGLDMPETTKEFKEVLIAFRDNDPNGNGLKDEIPYTTAIDGWMGGFPGALLNSFIYFNIKNRGMYLDGTSVKSAYNQDGFRKGLSYTAELFEEGLIDHDGLTRIQLDLLQLTEKSGENIIGAVNAGYWATFTNHGGPSGRYKDYRLVPPLKNDDGFVTTGYYFSAYPNCFTISSSCSSPEAAIRWADYIATPEGAYNMQFGPEGIGWEKPPEGAVGLNGEPALFVRLAPQDKNVNWGFDPGPPRYQPASQRLGEVRAPLEEMYEPNKLMTRLITEVIEKYVPYKPDISIVLPPIYISGDDNDRVNALEDDIYHYVDRSMVSFISGFWDINDDIRWGEFKTELSRLGLDELLEIYTKAYREQFID